MVYPYIFIKKIIIFSKKNTHVVNEAYIYLLYPTWIKLHHMLSLRKNDIKS